MTFRICFTFGLLTIAYNWWVLAWDQLLSYQQNCSSGVARLGGLSVTLLPVVLSTKQQ
jgi:hypothetical protein